MEGSDCRICLQPDLVSNMIVPCMCKGSQKFAHKNCLKQWLSIKFNDKCNVCGATYSGISYRKKPRSFIDYLLNAEAVLFKVIIGMCIYIMIIYLLSIGYSQYFTSHGMVTQPFRLILIVWTSIHTFLLMIIFPISLYKLYKSFKEWTQTHFTMELLDSINECTTSY